MSLVSDRPVGRVATFARDLVRLYRERNVPFLAGSVAYSAFVSLLPLALVLVIAAAAVGGDSFRQAAVDVAGQYLAPGALDVVDRSLAQATDRVGFSLFGAVALLWAVLKVFRTLDTAFATLYGSTDTPGLLSQIRDALVVLAAVTAAMLTMVAAGAVLALAPELSVGDTALAVPESPVVIRALSALGLVVGLTVAFLPMYYVFPNASVTLREVVPGAVVAAVGWAVLQAVFQVYVSLTSTSELYGVIGGVILFVTWLYFGAVVVLVGVATNVVLAGRVPPSPPADRAGVALSGDGGRER